MELKSDTSNIAIVDNDYIQIEYLPIKRIIYHTILKPISAQTELLKEALMKGTDFLAENRATKWLSDDRLNDPLPEEMVQWGLEVWNKKTIEAGWKYWALVVPEQVAAAGAMIPLIEILFEQGLRMRVFTQPEEALAWLDTLED